MILELKIKALQSLLEKDEPPKRKKKQRKSKLVAVRRTHSKEELHVIGDTNDMPQTSKLPSLLSLNTTTTSYSPLNYTNKRSNYNYQSNDNYDIQDMDIEQQNPSVSPYANIYQMNPQSFYQQEQLSYQTNYQQNDILNPAYFTNWTPSTLSTLTTLLASFRELNQNHFTNQLSPLGYQNPSLLPAPTGYLVQQTSPVPQIQPFQQRNYLKPQFKKKQRPKKVLRKPNLKKIETFQTDKVVAAPVLPSLMDVDERFIETTKLDTDFRQPNEKLIEEEKLLREILINSIKTNQQKTDERKVLEEVIVDETKQEDNDEEMKQLRLKLIDNMSKKRKEKEQLQEEQMAQDFSLLKRKLIEHEQELMTAQIETKKPDLIVQPFKQRKIMPVIIQLNADDDDDSDNENESNKTSLQQNIGLFLKEAKQQAILAPNLSLTNIEPKPKLAPTQSDLNIKSLRDKINLNSKEINELTKKSLELKLMKIKKDKDIESTKQKILTLKEQLIAAEKILNANEAAANLVKLQQKSTDLKLIKLISMKKTQQFQLQKLLSTAVVVKALPIVNKRIVLLPPTVVKTVVEIAQPPPLPTQPPPPLPPTPDSIEPTKAIEIIKPKIDYANIKLPVQMTLGGVVAASQSNLKKRNQYSISNLKPIADAITRPNLFTSKQTDKKLEQIALKTFEPEHNSQVISKVIDVKASKASPFKLQNNNISKKASQTSLILNKMKVETKQNDLINRQKLNDCLSDLIVIIFLINFTN